MANIFQRFGDIIKANVNDLIDKCEDPAKMIDQTMRDLKEDLAQVKKETAGVMAEEKRCKRNLDELQEEVNKLDGFARKAIQAGNDGDAKKFLEKKGALQQQLTTAQNNYNIAKGNADKMRQMHDKLVDDINLLEGRRENIKAQVAMAKAQETVNRASGASNAQAALDKFSRMEEKAQKQLDQAMAAAELDAEPEDSVDALEAKYSAGGASSVDDELARMKAEMGM